MSSLESQQSQSTKELKENVKQEEIIDLTVDDQLDIIKSRNKKKGKNKVFESKLYYEKRVVKLKVREGEMKYPGSEYEEVEDEEELRRGRKRKVSKKKDSEDINDDVFLFNEYFFLFKFEQFFECMKFLSEFLSEVLESTALTRFITNYEQIENKVFKDNSKVRKSEVFTFANLIHPEEKQFKHTVDNGNIEGLIMADLLEGDEEGDGGEYLTWFQFNHSIKTTTKATTSTKATTNKIFLVHGEVYDDHKDPIPNIEYHLYVHPSMIDGGGECTYINEILNNVITRTRLIENDKFHIFKSILHENTGDIRKILHKNTKGGGIHKRNGKKSTKQIT